MNESPATKALLDHYRALRPNAYVRKLSSRFQAHVLDVLIIDNGRAYVMEVKMEDNTVSDGQLRELAALEKANPRRNFVCWIDRKTRHVRLIRDLHDVFEATSLKAAAQALARHIALDSATAVE